jgi:hypothetical protein
VHRSVRKISRNFLEASRRHRDERKIAEQEIGRRWEVAGHCIPLPCPALFGAAVRCGARQSIESHSKELSMSKRHQRKASAKKTRKGQNRKERHTVANELRSEVERLFKRPEKKRKDKNPNGLRAVAREIGTKILCTAEEAVDGRYATVEPI